MPNYKVTAYDHEDVIIAADRFEIRDNNILALIKGTDESGDELVGAFASWVGITKEGE